MTTAAGGIGGRGRRADAAAGFSLVEVLVSMGITVTIVGATMGAMSQALRVNETAVNVTGMNRTLRVGMDLIIGDLLQVGSGLPPGHAILTPAGVQMNRPGPPGTTYTAAAGDTDIAAVIPGPGLGPTINGVPTDTITVLAADNNFSDIGLTAVTATRVDVEPGVNIGTGADRVLPGQLMLIEKGSVTTLVQVTAVDAVLRRITFALGDSLKLNQPSAASGNLAAVNAAAPANSPSSTRITRIRMISYYLDTVVTGHPRLIRRINNGNPTTFDNTLGTAVALDVENLQFTYDLADGQTNPANVRFTAADVNGTGACAPNPCSLNQVRKVNVLLAARSANVSKPNAEVFRNTLTSQISLRGMAFVDEYLAP
jgi:hypothetical protein